MAPDQIRQQTVVAQVMDEIRNLIASDAYAPGDKIPTEKELADRFGVGRSSIREAIKIFNYLGVLRSRAALGTYVQERSDISSEALSWSLLLGQDEIGEMIDLRGGIELWSLLNLVAGCAQARSSALETIAALKKIVDGMDSSVKAGRREELIEADFQFHYAIIRSAANPLFSSLYNTLRSFLYAEIRSSQDDYEDPAGICAEHRQLIAAFETGDMTLATTAFKAHIENIKNRLGSQTGS